MPTYKYKCELCAFEQMMMLPISSDPKEKRVCEDCSKVTMTRRIGKPQFPKTVGKVFAGDWYKKTYGQDVGDAYMEKAQQQESKKILEREFRKQTGQ